MADVMDILKGYKQTEVGVIPEDWEVILLGSVFEFKNGLNKEKRFFGQGTPIVNYMDVYKNTGIKAKDLNGRVTLSKQEIKNYETRKGDILFTRTSETIEEIGITSVVLEELENTVFSGFVLRARPLNKIFKTKFCQFCFSSKLVRKQILTTASLTTRALTNGRLLSNIKIPLPAKSEQTVIATALNDADTLITQLEKFIAKKRAIKQGTLQELMKPKKGWEVKRLRYVVHKFVNGGTPSTSVDKYWKGNIPWISGADILNQRIDKIRRYITEEAVKKSSTNVIEKGNLLFVSRTGVGKLAIVPFDIAISQDFTGIYVNKSCLVADYLYRYFDSISKELQNQNQGTSIKGITRETLSNFPIPLPRLKEQTRIARILSDMDAEIEALERKLEKYKRIKQGMMQALLTGKIRLM